MQYRAHSSAKAHMEFLCDKLAKIARAGHWLVLPYSTVLYITELQNSSLGIVSHQVSQNRLIVDYTFCCINKAKVEQAPPESMQFGKALDSIIQKAVGTNP